MSWIQMKQSALQYYFLRVLSKAKESCLTGEGVGGKKEKTKVIALPCSTHQPQQETLHTEHTG